MIDTDVKTEAQLVQGWRFEQFELMWPHAPVEWKAEMAQLDGPDLHYAAALAANGCTWEQAQRILAPLVPIGG